MTKALPAWFFTVIQKKVAKVEQRWILKQDSIYQSLGKFEYKESVNQSDIRVLHIHKRVLFRPPSCHIEVVNVGGARDYVACSYSWGDTTPKETIILNGKLFLVTESAYQVICRQQSFYGDSKVWIDSICINQGDVTEKAAQIKIMKDIFRTATHVEAFVEPDFHYFSLALFLQAISDRGKNVPSEFLALKWADHWKILAAFLQKPWFSRIWILQEAAVNRNLILINGSDRFSWQDFAKSLDTIRSEPVLESRLRAEMQSLNGNNYQLTNYMMEVTQKIDRIRNILSTDGHVPLSNLIAVSVGRGFRKPHDRIFALLGLAPSNVAELIHINYELPVEEIFSQTMKYLLDIEKDPQALRFAGLLTTSARKPTPSWVGTWTNNTSEVLAHTRCQFHSSARSCPNNMRPITNGNRLKVFTKRIGTILKVGQTWPGMDTSIRHRISAEQKARVVQEERRFLRQCWFSLAATTIPRQDRERTQSSGKFNDTWAKVYHVILMPRELGPSDTFISSARNDRVRWLKLLAAHFGRKWHQWEVNEVTPITGTQSDIWENGSHCEFRRYLAGYGSSQPALDSDTGVLSFVCEERDLPQAELFEYQVRQNLKGKRYAITSSRALAIVPEATEKTDQVHLIAGTDTPFVLRPKGSDFEDTGGQAFQLVGPCYVSGAMGGALAEDMNDFESPQSLWKKSVLI